MWYTISEFPQAIKKRQNLDRFIYLCGGDCQFIKFNRI